MITTDKDFANLPTKDHPRTYYGLSTDIKPTVNVINGACFVEMNATNNKITIYFFDKSSGTWIGGA